MLIPSSYTAFELNLTPDPQIDPKDNTHTMPGVLLIHGFMGDPSEMRPLAEWIYTHCKLYCYAPLLPGHGGAPHLMTGLHYRSWLQACQLAYEHVHQRCGSVIVIGFSMGGALATILPQINQAQALVLIAPMIQIRSPLVYLSPILSRIVPVFYPLRFASVDALGLREQILAVDPTLNLDDPETLKKIRTEVRFPTPILRELLQLSQVARKSAPRITIPTLVVQGDNDATLHPAGARAFYNTSAAKDKVYKSYPDAGHDLVNPGNDAFAYLLPDVSTWLNNFLEEPTVVKHNA